MIIQKITMPPYQWTVRILYDTSCEDINTIIDELNNIKCPEQLINSALENLEKCHYNTGLTYSNFSFRQTVIVVGKTSSKKEFLNTLVHELYHFVSQFARVNNMSVEEDRATLIGEIAMRTYNIIRDVINVK